jgi:hypothetical protein
MQDVSTLKQEIKVLHEYNHIVRQEVLESQSRGAHLKIDYLDTFHMAFALFDLSLGSHYQVFTE